MSTERASKKRKTRSGCSGIELSSAFLVLQKFRDTITTVTESDNDINILENVDNPELDVEMDQDALVQLDGLLRWMNSKIKSITEVYLTACIRELTLGQVPQVLLYPGGCPRQHPAFAGTTPLPQI